MSRCYNIISGDFTMTKLDSPVLVLNKYLLAMQVTTARCAIRALAAERAKVIDLHYQTYTLREWIEKSLEIDGLPGEQVRYLGTLASPTIRLYIPQVIQAPTLGGKSSILSQVKYSRPNVYRRDRYTCQYCGKLVPRLELTVDHIIPRCERGKASWENIVTACKPCNLRKGNRSLAELGWVTPHPRAPDWRCHVTIPFGSISNDYWSIFLQGER